MKICLSILLSFIFGLFNIKNVEAQDSSVEIRLMRSLRDLQVREDGPFVKGGFGSFREYQLKPGTYKRDKNVFYTGLILMTLREIYPSLAHSSKLIADSIIADAIPSFQQFKNQKGRPTFNFWSTNPPQIFPEGGFLNFYNKSRALPDDMDCTSISTIALNREDSIAAKVHHLMQGFTNDGKNRLMPTFPEVQHLPVYSTWFGIKMAVELDAPVICNVLTMVHHYQLPLTRADSASIQYLSTIIEKRYHLSEPIKVSPNYASTAVILYHYSRLMNTAKIPSLEKLKPILVHDADSLYRVSENIVEKMMLSTALHRWNAQPSIDTIEINGSLENAIRNSRFIFFIANLGTGFPDGWKHELASGRAGRFNYYCPAYDIVLVLENLVSTKIHN